MGPDSVLFTIECAAAVVFIVTATVVAYLRNLRRAGARAQFGSDHAVPSVGLLHPNAGGGGGGERVLWIALQTLMAADRRSGTGRMYTLYTRRYPAPADFVDFDDADATGGADCSSAASPTQRTPRQRNRDARDTAYLLSLARDQFGVDTSASGGGGVDPRRLNVVYLTYTWLLDPKYYPRLTLVLQSFVGGLALFWDVAFRGATDVIVDTVGVPCSYWLFSLVCGSTVAAYVHYPVISSDMVGKVAARRADFNNAGGVAGSSMLTKAKLGYYRAFGWLYRMCGGNFADVVMTNSSWTDDHVRHMWARRDTQIVYPPCGIPRFVAACPTLDPDARDNTVVSVGQFRPEKDHSLQLRAFARAIGESDGGSGDGFGALPSDATLVLVGGCRDEGDRRRVAELRAEADRLGLTAAGRVRFEISVPAARVVELLSRATVGLHTMRDEHFGIVVAEYMAAGAVAVAHDSAGPRRDIVERPGETGLLATTEAEYATAVRRAFALRLRSPAEWRRLTESARASAGRFTDQYFAARFARRLAPVLALTLLPEEDDDGVKLCC